jgi:hypothetical protein
LTGKAGADSPENIFIKTKTQICRVIPNIFHFVFGMAEDFGGRPFSLSHYLAVKSAMDVNAPDTIFFHYAYEPTGYWWEKIKPHLLLNKINAPASFMGRPVEHIAHKADVVRLQVLQESGGIYLDMDTISVKPLTDWLHHSFVIGREFKAAYLPKNRRQKLKHTIRTRLGLTKKMNGAETGLCNAVMLSEKNSWFASAWLKEYKTFRSTGRDKYWNEHSVLIPQQLAAQFPEAITIAGPRTFHYPLYDSESLKTMFETVHEFPEAYLHHLWESFSWNKYLSKLTVENIRNTDTTYNCIARKFLTDI